MLINVTQAHIDNGEPGNPCHCPVALALDEGTPEGMEWSVSHHAARNINQRDQFQSRASYAQAVVSLPNEVTEFISRFDSATLSAVMCHPFSFEFNPGGTGRIKL